ncbi:MAG: zinc ribbon domain-containing protein [Methanomassiliicoccus sp.]|nr:zinc ribbon domain-containing protein [Methanomassiliicoccus sp.]
MPLQRLFVRRDSRLFAQLSPEDAVPAVQAFLGQAHFQVWTVGPYQVHAEQYFQKLGLRRTMDVWISTQSGGAVVTAEISATLGDTEAAVGLVGAIIYLPLAVAVGAVSYIDYEQDANALLMSLWGYLGSTGARSRGESGDQQRRCGNCGLSIDPDARFCKRCGAQVTGVTG